MVITDKLEQFLRDNHLQFVGGTPKELRGRFNSFIVTEFDDSLSVEMQLRSMLKWIKENIQVTNDTVAYVDVFKDLITEIILTFIAEYDTHLSETLTNTLEEWQQSGKLDVVVGEALQWELDDYKSTNDQKVLSLEQQLAQTEQDLTAQLQQKALNSDLITEVSNRKQAVTSEEMGRKAEIAIERSRIDVFTALTAGSTTGDAELIDAHVGLGGIEYTNTGTNIRRQGQQTTGLISSEILTFTTGYNITIGSVAVGSTVNMTPEAVNFYSYNITTCQHGDKFMINALGGDNPRTYAFIDKNNNLLVKSGASYKMIDTVITAPLGADRLIINSLNTYLGVCYKHVIGRDFYELRNTLIGSFIPKAIELITGFNINLNVGIGNQVNLTPETVAFYKYAIVDCVENELFVINGTGGNNPRLWGFIDGNNKLLQVSGRDLTVSNLVITTPKNAVKLVINITAGTNDICYRGLVDNKIIGQIVTDINTIKNDDTVEKTQKEIEFMTGTLNQLLTVAGKPIVLQVPYKYTAWPFISAAGEKLVCIYTRSLSHEEPTSASIYSRFSSDGGFSWSMEKEIINTDSKRDTVTGKGTDLNGAMLFWNRVGTPGSSEAVHQLYKTSDGITFIKISEPVFTTVPGHIGDIFEVPTVGLLAFYNTFGTNRAWGYLRSTDNGITWTQHPIETELSQDDCPTEISGVYLQDGKILAMGRKDTGSGTVAMFQLESSNYGVTWTKSYTNITDIGLSTPSLIYDEATDLLHLYYFHRGPGILRLRKSTASSVFGSPLNWTASQEIAQGTTNFQDTGNANATLFNDKHIVTYYSGDATNTGIYAKIVTP